MGLQSGLAKRSFFNSENTALGMPDGRFSIIDKKPFSNLNLQIRVHPIHHFRKRCPFRAVYHANQLEQTTHLPLLGGLFEPIFEWMGDDQVINNNDTHNHPFCTSAQSQPI